MREIIDDNCLGLAAQLAFYFLLALFPALIFLVALISVLPVEGVMAELLAPLSNVAPPEVVRLLREQLQDIVAGDHGGLLTLGILGAIWSSSSAMSAIISTLNHAYDIEDRRPLWKTRLLAIGLTVVLAGHGPVLALLIPHAGLDASLMMRQARQESEHHAGTS